MTQTADQATVRLTPEFLKANIVNFRPRNKDEARMLQQYLLDQGLFWLTGERVVQRVDACVMNGLHLDKGRLVTGNDRRSQYVDATLSEVMAAAKVKVVGQPAPASSAVAKPALTRASFDGKSLIFAPTTAEEAAFVQEVLFSMGFSWNDGQRHVILQNECVAKKMNIREGRIRYGVPSDGKYVMADFRDLPGYDAADLRSPQEKMQDRVTALEAEVAALKAALARLTAPTELPRIVKPIADADIVQKRKSPQV